MKVLIFSVSTGQGHNGAAKAVAEHLCAMGVECVIDDAVFRVGSWLGVATNMLYSLAINACRFSVIVLAVNRASSKDFFSL